MCLKKVLYPSSPLPHHPWQTWNSKDFIWTEEHRSSSNVLAKYSPSHMCVTGKCLNRYLHTCRYHLVGRRKYQMSNNNEIKKKEKFPVFRRSPSCLVYVDVSRDLERSALCTLPNNCRGQHRLPATNRCVSGWSLCIQIICSYLFLCIIGLHPIG